MHARVVLCVQYVVHVCNQTLNVKATIVSVCKWKRLNRPRQKRNSTHTHTHTHTLSDALCTCSNNNTQPYRL